MRRRSSHASRTRVAASCRKPPAGRATAAYGHTTRGDWGHLMLKERIVQQSEVIRFILLEDSPCCWVTHRGDGRPLVVRRLDGCHRRQHLKVASPSQIFETPDAPAARVFGAASQAAAFWCALTTELMRRERRASISSAAAAISLAAPPPAAPAPAAAPPWPAAATAIDRSLWVRASENGHDSPMWHACSSACSPAAGMLCRQRWVSAYNCSSVLNRIAAVSHSDVLGVLPGGWHALFEGMKSVVVELEQQQQQQQQQQQLFSGKKRQRKRKRKAVPYRQPARPGPVPQPAALGQPVAATAARRRRRRRRLAEVLGQCESWLTATVPIEIPTAAVSHDSPCRGARAVCTRRPGAAAPAA